MESSLRISLTKSTLAESDEKVPKLSDQSTSTYIYKEENKSPVRTVSPYRKDKLIDEETLAAGVAFHAAKSCYVPRTEVVLKCYTS